MRTVKRVGLGLSIAALIIVVVVRMPAAGAEPAELGPELAYVVAGLRQARTALDPASVRVSLQEAFPMQWVTLWHEELTPDRTLDDTGQYALRTEHGRWARSGRRRALAIDSPSVLVTDERAETQVLRKRLVINDREIRSLTLYQQLPVGGAAENYATGLVGPADQTAVDHWWIAQEWVDPAYAAYAYGQGPETLSIETWLTRPEAHAEYLGEEDLEGSSCHVVRFEPVPEQQVTVWLDEAHSFVKRQLTVTTWVEGQERVMREEHVPELLESSARWLPAVWDMTAYWYLTEAELADFRARGAELPDVIPEDGWAVLRPVRMRLVFDSFQVGLEPPPEVVSLEWPVGTRVTDQRTGRTFRVMAVDHAGEERLRRAAP